MKNYGFTPPIRSLFGGDGLGGGFELELIKLLRQKERFPNFTLKGSTLWTLDSITEYKAQVLQDRIAGTGLRAGGNFKYENRGEEHFYGIGPNTSLGDGTSYRIERTTLESLLGYAFWATWDIQGKFAYQNVNITNGEDGGRGIIDKIFVESGRQAVPGLSGDELLTLGFDLNHDNRDSQDMPTTGGYERFHFSWNKGIESSSGFFKYRGEAAHFFKLLSERRVFALRGVVEHNDEFGDREVPFFSMARLGGYGAGLRYGDVHRGYKRDRFYDESLLLFNAEYRWAAWEYRDWRMDPVLFCDLGQVFGEWSDFQFEDFRVSYGLGFRVSFEKEVVFTVDIARSNEGTEFYVKTRTPF
jgi:outer membrane protein assembly factor BamA